MPETIAPTKTAAVAIYAHADDFDHSPNRELACWLYEGVSIGG